MGRGPGSARTVDVRLQTPQVVATAEDLARYLLTNEPERLAHTKAVADRAQLFTAATSAEQAPFLVAAAWLHDIGYHPSLRETGFHPLDGALHLQRAGWPSPMCDLVAHHSGSRFVAAARQLDTELSVFAFVEDEVTDALTVADQTAGPNGRLMTVPERIQDMLTRHGPDSPNARAHPDRGPYLLAAAHRVAARLERAGVGPRQHGIFALPDIEADQPRPR
jgi:hypothetical protein